MVCMWFVCGNFEVFPKMKLTIIHIFTHISLNIDPRILNPHTPEYPFPSAGHI